MKTFRYLLLHGTFFFCLASKFFFLILISGSLRVKGLNLSFH